MIPVYSFKWCPLCRDLRQNLFEFQTLWGGTFALVAGALAYKGLREQNTILSRHRFLDDQRRTREDIEARQEQKRQRRAKSAAVARSLYYPLRRAVARTSPLIKSYDKFRNTIEHQQEFMRFVERDLLGPLDKAIEGYDEALKWVRDVAVDVRPKSQANLLLMFDETFVRIRRIEQIIEALRMHLQDGTFPDRNIIAEMTFPSDQLRRCVLVLEAIFDGRGRTNTEEVDKLVLDVHKAAADQEISLLQPAT